MSVRRRGSRRRPGLAPAFSFAPMVDIVLLLLIFFMSATTFLGAERGLAVELPTSSAAAAEANRLTVDVAADGRIAYGGRSDLSAGGLETSLRAALGGRADTVTLRADRAARHGRVVEVMDAIKRAGAGRLTVSTREP